MKIDVKIGDDVFSYEKLQYLLKAHYAGAVFEAYPKKEEERLINFIHNKVKERLPKIFDTFIVIDKLPVSIYGHIYYQIIVENNRYAWKWLQWDIQINSLIWLIPHRLEKHLAESLLVVLKKAKEHLKENGYDSERKRRLKAINKLIKYVNSKLK